MQSKVLQETIGECLGLERAAQKAVEELDSKGLLKGDARNKVFGMHGEAGKHEDKLQTLMDIAIKSEGLEESSIEEHAEEALQKTSEMMKTYLGEDPDELDALEFLSIAEGGEVVHYEVLKKLAGKVKDKKFATGVNAILAEEKRHMQMCTKLAQQASTKE